MDHEMIDTLTGTFKHIIYRSESYMVARFESEEGLITVTGPSFDIEKGTRYELSGSYVDHPRYGFQFQILKVEKALPKVKEDIISFLSYKLIKGIGKKAAEKVYDALGDETLKILKEDTSVLQGIDLTMKQILSIEEGFASMQDPEHEILFELVSHGFNNLEAQRIFSRFKLATIEVGEENPFRYYNDVYGMPFEKVKRYAYTVDFEDKELKYQESYLFYLFTDFCFRSGDTYLEKQDLLVLLQKNGLSLIEEAFESALTHNYLIDEEGRIYLFNDYQNERFIADYLYHFPKGDLLEREEIEEGIRASEYTNSIGYDKAQKEAIASFFLHPVSMIVGGPGTGKTTIVKAMVELYRDLFPFNNIIVIAPTGRAAKRITEICDVEAKTIHSLLRWNKEANTFVYDIDNPVLYDAVIVDEFSMVDQDLFASLCKAGSRFKKLCLIGDDNQLPSIRPGSVLRDLVESELFPVSHLSVNYRQNEGSEIIDLSSSIISGSFDLTSYHKDITFIENRISHEDLLSLINQDLKEGYELDDIQILTPMYRGDWGIDNLNMLLQNTYNPRSIDKAERNSGRM
ncbi:MAG: AAA family ATPase, partial [Erysipelotrichaceae bacterium]|nr:AAA family ATPase [Erysipelotrichaceae bacterium]